MSRAEEAIQLNSNKRKADEVEADDAGVEDAGNDSETGVVVPQPDGDAAGNKRLKTGRVRKSSHGVSLAFRQENSWRKSYIRTRHKNLRCFPCCSARHMENGFCGQSIFVYVHMERKEMLQELGLTINGSLRKTDSPRLHEVGAETETLPLRDASNQNEVVYGDPKAWDADLRCWLVEFVPPRRWRYNCKLAKHTMKQQHTFSVYVCAKRLSGEGEESAAWRCIATADSPPFRLTSAWKQPGATAAASGFDMAAASARGDGSPIAAVMAAAAAAAMASNAAAAATSTAHNETLSALAQLYGAGGLTGGPSLAATGAGGSQARLLELLAERHGLFSPLGSPSSVKAEADAEGAIMDRLAYLQRLRNLQQQQQQQQQFDHLAMLRPQQQQPRQPQLTLQQQQQLLLLEHQQRRQQRPQLDTDLLAVLGASAQQDLFGLSPLSTPGSSAQTTTARLFEQQQQQQRQQPRDQQPRDQPRDL